MEQDDILASAALKGFKIFKLWTSYRIIKDS